jgi:cell division initiation protein
MSARRPLQPSEETTMFDRQPGQAQTPSSTSAAQTGSLPPERVMRIAPLDLRQQRFRTALRGFDRTEVVAFLTEAADDYEHALREIDRLRQDLLRMEALLAEHRDREANLRNTLLTAQRLADEVKAQAENEGKIIVREAQGRADLLLQKASARLEEIERDINELRLRRRDVEGSLEASIQSLYRALEFIREQDKEPEEKVLLHRPRTAEPAATPQWPASEQPPRVADERG